MRGRIWLMTIIAVAAVLAACGGSGNNSNADDDGPREVDLRAYVDDLDYAQAFSDDYVAPTIDELAAFERALDRLRAGDRAGAREAAAALDYHLLSLRDRADGGVYDCLQERAGEARGRGFYCLRREAGNSHHLSVPHPLYDADTNVQSVEILRGFPVGYYSVATAQRCASSEYSPCSGSTVACGLPEPYRESDMSHVTQSFFHSFSVWVHDGEPESYHLQLHGCGELLCPSGEDGLVAVLSVGTTEVLPEDELVNRLDAELRQRVQAVAPGATTQSCSLAADDDAAFLCSTSNTQGRYINGSPDACTEDAPAHGGSRFLHIEQNGDLRRPADGSERIDTQLLIDALHAVF